MSGEAKQDYLGMSDEDFLKVNSPASAAESGAEGTDGNQVETPGSTASGEVAATAEVKEPEKKAEGEDGAVVTEPGDTQPAADGGAGDAAPVDSESDKTGKPDSEEAPKDKTVPEDPDKPTDPKADPSGSKPKDGAAAPEKKDDAKAEAKPIDYEGFFKQVMAPFKANGRTIELKTPEEAIRLMQMGAGFGRKIQDLQPYLKVVRMLEKNNLLDEGKLSFLIDINQKNPEAIKKIIKDSGIDPLDLNITDNVDYHPSNHSVSDEEVEFNAALKVIQTYPTGQETLRLINQNWDDESKKLLWKEPQILEVIQTQRDHGIYDQIVAEIDRQKLLGQMPQSTPFLQAYKAAGDMLFPQAAQAAPVQTQPGNTQQPQVIATRTAAPKAQVQNSDKAAAAAQTKAASTRKASAVVNPLEMADDEFLKQFNGRL